MEMKTAGAGMRRRPTQKTTFCDQHILETNRANGNKMGGRARIAKPHSTSQQNKKESHSKLPITLHSIRDRIQRVPPRSVELLADLFESNS